MKEKAQSVADGAAAAVQTGEQYAQDVRDAASNAAQEAAKTAQSAPAAATRAGLPANPGVDYRASKAAKNQKEKAAGLAVYTDDGLTEAVGRQRLKVDTLAAGSPERVAAQRELGVLENEQERRAEHADRPDASVTQETSYARPVGMFVGGLVSGLASGGLGPVGAGVQLRLDYEVDKRGTGQDKFAFGLGSAIAGAMHSGHGLAMMAGASAGDTITFGAGSALAIPTAAVGGLETAGGLTIMEGGRALASKGSVSGAKPVARPAQNKLPNGMDDKHILNGEVKTTRGGKLKASGFHHNPEGAQSRARIPRDAIVTEGPHGLKRASVVEIKDPATGTWVRKNSPTTFFPENWDKSRVRSEIMDAYANRNFVDGETWRGVSSSGIEVEGAVDETGFITTAYPKF